MPLLDFSQPVAQLKPVPQGADSQSLTEPQPPRPPQGTAPAFGEEPDLPPTWSEHSRIFHTTEKCTRLQAIRRNRRITGNPGLRDHCLNCLDIVSTKRRG